MPFVFTGATETDDKGRTYQVIDLEKTIIDESSIALYDNQVPRNIRTAQQGESLNTPLDSGYPREARGGELIFTMIVKGPDGEDIVDTYPALDFSVKPARPWTMEDVDKAYTLAGGDINSTEGATFMPKPAPKEFIPVQENIAVLRPEEGGGISRQLIRSGGAFRVTRNEAGQPSLAGGVNPEAMAHAWKRKPTSDGQRQKPKDQFKP